MHLRIGLDDVGTKPGAFFLIAILGGSTTAYYAVEILIDGRLQRLLTKQLLHGVADMNLAGKDDEALHGTEPQGLVFMAIGVPREKTVGIGQQQTINREVAADGYQSVILAQMRVGKPKVVV